MTEETKLYLARGGRNGEDEDTALESNLAIIGFRKVPSLAEVKDYQGILQIVAQANPGAKTRAVGNHAGQLWAFVLAMKTGDLVVMPRRLVSQVAIGRVDGPYEYKKIGEDFRHTRPVKWVRQDVPRTAFEQDLLYSFGAALTVCNIQRNNAVQRVTSVISGGSDPGLSLSTNKISKKVAVEVDDEQAGVPNLSQLAHDQIVAHIQSKFTGHALSVLVDAVLKADGWVTKVSPAGADGGVDILAGRGSLGLDAPRLCVQVKSQNSPTDVTVYRTLQGTMQTFKAEQGLLVCWGGFNRAVLSESKQGHFTVRLWDSSDLVEAIYRNYEKLPAEIQAELPLKKAWMLVVEEPDQ
jgi:restriction system protein